MQSVVKTSKIRRKTKVRENIQGTKTAPRLSVYRSNKYIYAQLIDDVAGTTLVSVFDVSKKLHSNKTKVDASKEVGIELAKRAISKNIYKVVFDRGEYRYHGRVKSLADGAREGGLRF
jgi:large subunit ribosomal protein L18